MGRDPLQFVPGSIRQSSNTNYLALGLIIEKRRVTAMPTSYRSRVLDPLGLRATSLSSSS